MKNILKSVKVIAIILAALFVNNSCSNLFDNPLKDKDTDEEITLILLDLNFFDTKLNFYFVEEGSDEFEYFCNAYTSHYLPDPLRAKYFSRP